jgi:hypothetical protein
VLQENHAKIAKITKEYDGWEKWLQAEIFYISKQCGYAISVEQNNMLWTNKSMSVDFVFNGIYIELKCKKSSHYGAGSHRGKLIDSPFGDVLKLSRRKPACVGDSCHVVYVRGCTLFVCSDIPRLGDDFSGLQARSFSIADMAYVSDKTYVAVTSPSGKVLKELRNHGGVDKIRNEIPRGIFEDPSEPEIDEADIIPEE